MPLSAAEKASLQAKSDELRTLIDALVVDSTSLHLANATGDIIRTDGAQDHTVDLSNTFAGGVGVVSYGLVSDHSSDPVTNPTIANSILTVPFNAIGTTTVAVSATDETSPTPVTVQDTFDVTVNAAVAGVVVVGGPSPKTIMHNMWHRGAAQAGPNKVLGVQEDDFQAVLTIEPSGNVIKHISGTVAQPDDHNSGDVAVAPNGNVWHVWCNHKGGTLNLEISTDNGETWGSTISLPGGNPTEYTYPQIQFIHNHIHVYYRRGNDDWIRLKSTDNGATWTRKVVWRQAGSYLTCSKTDDNTIDFVVSLSPIGYASRILDHFSYKKLDGAQTGSFHGSDGTEIHPASEDDNGGTIAASTATATLMASVWAPNELWACDVKRFANGKAIGLYQVSHETDESIHDIRCAYHDGTDWANSLVVVGGKSIAPAGSSSYPIGGWASLSDDGTKVVAAVEDAGKLRIQELTTTDGSSWGSATWKTPTGTEGFFRPVLFPDGVVAAVQCLDWDQYPDGWVDSKVVLIGT